MTSIIIPSTGRPAQLKSCIEGLLPTVKGRKTEIIVVIEHDHESEQVAHDLPVRVIARQEHRGPVYGWNEGAAASSGSEFVLGADDLEWHDGWLDGALETMRELDGFGMVGLNDPMVGMDHFPEHFMVSRRYCVEKWGGVFLCPHYRHYYVDPEAYNRAMADGRYRWCEKAIITHRHPWRATREHDKTYDIGRTHFTQDEKIFEARKKAGFPNDYYPIFGMDGAVGDAAPAQERKRQVWYCVLPERCVYDISYNVGADLHYTCGKRGYNILKAEYGRTDMSRQGLAEVFLLQATRPDDTLVMLDIDHDHPPFVIDRLVSHNVPVVVPLMFRRGAPYQACAFRRNGDGGLHHLATFPPGLHRMDAVGHGAIAIQRQVFDKLRAAGHRWFWKYEYGHGEMKSPSEDLYFSNLCEKHGIEMYVDTCIETPHITYGFVDKVAYEEYMKDNPQPVEPIGRNV